MERDVEMRLICELEDVGTRSMSLPALATLTGHVQLRNEQTVSFEFAQGTKNSNKSREVNIQG